VIFPTRLPQGFVRWGQNGKKRGFESKNSWNYKNELKYLPIRK
jgi:hypothetical protein